MPSKDLEKLRIVQGDDMNPCIRPDEYLLLDRRAVPQVGDVVVFENKFGRKVAHRMIYAFAGFCFTKGDNCPLFDFPVRRDKVIGVVVGKSRQVPGKPVAHVLLALFLPQFIIYSSLFDIRKKKYFLMLSAASRFYPHTEAKANG
jgi:hypothetical protein